jgi:hypothetical protein
MVSFKIAELEKRNPRVTGGKASLAMAVELINYIKEGEGKAAKHVGIKAKVLTGDLAGKEVVVKLSEKRTYKDRPEIAAYAKGKGMIPQVVKGGTFSVRGAYIQRDGSVEAREVAVIAKNPEVDSRVLTGHVRVMPIREIKVGGETFHRQNVVVAHVKDAAQVEGIEAAKAAMLKCLEGNGCGTPGFILRVVDDEGKAIAISSSVRWNKEAERLETAEEALASFAARESITVSGAKVELSGEGVMELLGDGQWEVIPTTTVTLGGEIVTASIQKGRDASKPFRFEKENEERKLTGFVDGYVSAILSDKGNWFTKQASPARTDLSPVSAAYLPTVFAQPVFTAEASEAHAAEEHHEEQHEAATTAETVQDITGDDVDDVLAAFEEPDGPAI